ncbi:MULTISPECIES: 1-acyl-sn-glycerol-3-phosphate acyltransferase [unclassified Leeuwenhoekiella]|uniref:1-acyl-sn-glycerol-3-phosphate acyltransferase n=1 Tax=unclassified Leeuwenhoekiella TaxID=2615029 RepID=UPI000C54F0ED|nr:MULTISPECIES: 1-acyl-sn-glycerol-3-phosphate acyltransferase [unclassified Leeuwenhoekiella]MAW96335.1 glycerol acyltransferase [Leeuwenhoekiella sp.]MBA81222.1 glycerol acyltransferase [Leeuwenhoekiella sp.]
MSQFDSIRPYYDTEVHEILKEFYKHPMFQALLQFTFPDKKDEEIKSIVESCHSIYDFQTRIIYQSIQRVMEKSTDGFSTSGFDDLERNKAYFFLSNHRDIILDTSFINVALFDHDLVMTASAIGDNLVKKSFLLALARLNRSFLVQRSLSPREMLVSSKKLSEYLAYLLQQNQSIWMAQREGRTKDGSDKTQQGVLKMAAMARGNVSAMTYLKSLNIRPVAISYEFDPTDILKVPELIAKSEDLTYVKSNNEDFNSIMRGALGNKKRIHIAAGKLNPELFDKLEGSDLSENDKLQELAKHIDREIYRIYKLWPSNYVAYDLYHNTKNFAHTYTDRDKRNFERRIERRVNPESAIALESFLLMYANPVINKLKSLEPTK